RIRSNVLSRSGSLWTVEMPNEQGLKEQDGAFFLLSNGSGMSSHDRQWLTVSEIAQYCEVSQGTVRRWIKQNILPAIRVAGGHYRIKTMDFREFLRRQSMSVREDFFRSQAQKE
ncbi:MAG: helix-turn-helix domain-containing protein, partial [Dehalococcoidales bacterium]|nr:helix-turn-helix domain-containing protein [Dehalococcoidales bacterium]